MELVTLAVSLSVVMLVGAVLLGWATELKRAGGAVSARESRAAAERVGGPVFYTREARAEAMRERIRRERRRRERVREQTRTAEESQRPPPGPDRPAAPAPESPEAVHRATLELGPGPVAEDVLRVHYRRLVVAYHPDRVAGLGQKLQRLAEEETKSINEAYAFFKGRL